MRLLTHNMLMSPGTKNGYPLAIQVEKMEEVEAEFNADFTARMVEKIDYAALLSTLASVRGARSNARGEKNHGSPVHARAPQLKVDSKLPSAVPDKFAEDETFLQALHRSLVIVLI